MRSRLLALAERRARLSARAAIERDSLAAVTARGDAAVGRVEAVLAVVRRALGELREQPLLLAAGVALLVALRPRRVLGWTVRWGLKAWPLWRGYRAAQRVWHRLSAAPAAPTSAGR